MQNDIVSKLMRKTHRNDIIKESFSIIKEADEDEEEMDIDTEEPKTDAEDVESPEREEPEGNSRIPSPRASRGSSHSSPSAEEEAPEETPEPMKPAPPVAKSSNPLDNNFAVNFNIGDKVTFVYANGTSTEMNATIEGYDKEGFYRVKWDNGSVSNGITDTALRAVTQSQDESTCVCGSTDFVVENESVVCDRCGRKIREGLDHLTVLDQQRPKGKKMIRSIPHDMSTATRPNIPMSEDEELPFVGYQNEI